MAKYNVYLPAGRAPHCLALDVEANSSLEARKIVASRHVAMQVSDIYAKLSADDKTDRMAR